MRIACLQFAPQVGDVSNNLNRADAVLNKANPHDLDLLVLPELAFSGYNFKSLQHISPFLEPTASGITSLWARTIALKYQCVVTVGYPEKVDVTPKWPASPEYYNSAITVDAEGQTIANYRKSFLYYTDETWALEGPDGFYDGEIEGLGNVAMGICKWPTKSFQRMDLNPYKFEAPWNAWEFAFHILHRESNLVILSMAWLTREDARSYSRSPKEPDMDTLSYWLARLEPIIRAENEDEIIVVLANRCGTEDDAVYAGTSAVLGVHAGEVKVYGILGRGEKELLVVDTNLRPQAKLISNHPTNIAKTNRDSNASASSDSKSTSLHSTFSNEPTKSTSTSPSIDTPNIERVTSQNTLAIPSPTNTNVKEVRIDNIITPISPVDPKSPSLFFNNSGQEIDSESRKKGLKSAIEVSHVIKSSPTDLSIDTRNIERVTSRNTFVTPEAMEVDVTEIINDNIITPISPVDPNTSTPFFNKGGQLAGTEFRKEGLRSTIEEPQVIDVPEPVTAEPDSPTLFRHEPMERRSSEQLQEQQHTNTPPIPKDSAEMHDASSFVRPPSPKSRNCSRTRHRQYHAPALMSHDLAQEPQMTTRTLVYKPSAYSASAVPDHYKQTLEENRVDAPRRHVLPRPKSMSW